MRSPSTHQKPLRGFNFPSKDPVWGQSGAGRAAGAEPSWDAPSLSAPGGIRAIKTPPHARKVAASKRRAKSG